MIENKRVHTKTRVPTSRGLPILIHFHTQTHTHACWHTEEEDKRNFFFQFYFVLLSPLGTRSCNKNGESQDKRLRKGNVFERNCPGSMENSIAKGLLSNLKGLTGFNKQVLDAKELTCAYLLLIPLPRMQVCLIIIRIISFFSWWPVKTTCDVSTGTARASCRPQSRMN